MTLRAAAQAVLEAAEDASALSGRVYVGNAPLDVVEGQEWALMVAVESIIPVNGFPTPWTGAEASCAPQPAGTLHVVVARCVPTIEAFGTPVPAEESEAHLDLAERATKVWLALARMAPDVLVGEAAPFTVQGGWGWIDLPVQVDIEEFC